MCSAKRAGGGPRRMVVTTRFVAGSILETLGPPAFATQTASGATAMPEGCGPTWIVAVTLFVTGSIRETVSSDGEESQTAPSPAAPASGAGPVIRAPTAPRAGPARIGLDSRI